MQLFLSCSGQQGRPGPQGPSGGPGPSGPSGPSGVRGPIGNPGSQGPPGGSGPTGAQGPVGASGPTGPQGPQGTQGDVGGVGPRGPAGPAGSGLRGVDYLLVQLSNFASSFALLLLLLLFKRRVEVATTLRQLASYFCERRRRSPDHRHLRGDSERGGEDETEGPLTGGGGSVIGPLIGGGGSIIIRRTSPIVLPPEQLEQSDSSRQQSVAAQVHGQPKPGTSTEQLLTGADDDDPVAHLPKVVEMSVFKTEQEVEFQLGDSSKMFSDINIKVE